MSDHVDRELSEDGRNSLPPTQVKLIVSGRPGAPIRIESYEGQKRQSAQPADSVPQPADSVPWTHKKIRSYLILSFFVIVLVLVGTNRAFGPFVTKLAGNPPITRVRFEGTIHPANEIRITAESAGTVSIIAAKVGDRVQKGQELLRMDDREAELNARQAGVELDAAKAKLDKFRLELAEADARVAIAQRQEQLVPARQSRDSPERAAAAYDLALANFNRSKELYEAGILARQELDAKAAELRLARDDLENAKEAARASATLTRDQTEQVRLQAKITRAELQEQLRKAELAYQRATQQLDAMVVRATEAGVVSDIPVHLGDRITGGATLAQLAELRQMRAEVPVAAEMIRGLRVGQPARVRLALSQQEINGRIGVINPLPSSNMTHKVEVEFDNPTFLLLAGQPAEVSFVAP